MKLHTSKPPIHTFPIFANILSIISAHKDAEEWYFSNFIHLNASPKNHTLSFYDCWSYIYKCPLIIRNSIERWIITEKWNGDFISFLIDTLNKNTYVYLFIDEAKLSNSILSKQHNSFTHDIMVQGYNKEKKEFYISGSFASGKYIESTCTFVEMQSAYDHTDISKDWLEGIQMIRLNKEKSYQLHIPYLKQQLMDYLKSENIAMKIDDPPYYEEYFGVNVYEVLIDYLRKLIDGSKTNLLIKPFHFLWEHKKCMLDRINYFEEKGILSSKQYVSEIKGIYTELNEKTLIHRNIMLKNLVKGDLNNLQKIASELLEIKKKETRAITLLIESFGC